MAQCLHTRRRELDGLTCKMMDFQLSPELLGLQQSVRRSRPGQDQAPGARDRHDGRVSPGHFRRVSKGRSARTVHSRGVRRIGCGHLGPHAHDRRGDEVLQRARPDAASDAAANRADHDRGQRGAKAEVPARYCAVANARAAFCLSEPGAGSDVAGMRTHATRGPRRRRRVHPQRHEVLDLWGHAGRLVRRLRQDRRPDVCDSHTNIWGFIVEADCARRHPTEGRQEDGRQGHRHDRDRL